jgi:hypothetical protein
VAVLGMGQMKESFSARRTKKRVEILQATIAANPDATMGEIGEMLGWPLSRVAYHIQQAKIPWRSKKSLGGKHLEEEVQDFIVRNPELKLAGLAKHFGVTVNALTTYMSNHNLYQYYVPKKCYTQTEEYRALILARIKEAATTCKTLDAIAAVCRLGAGTVKRYMKKFPDHFSERYGKSHYTEAKKQLVEAWIRANPRLSAPDIATCTGVNYRTVYRIIRGNEELNKIYEQGKIDERK